MEIFLEKKYIKTGEEGRNQTSDFLPGKIKLRLQKILIFSQVVKTGFVPGFWICTLAIHCGTAIAIYHNFGGPRTRGAIEAKESPPL